MNSPAQLKNASPRAQRDQYAEQATDQGIPVHGRPPFAEQGAGEQGHQQGRDEIQGVGVGQRQIAITERQEHEHAHGQHPSHELERHTDPDQRPPRAPPMNPDEQYRQGNKASQAGHL